MICEQVRNIKTITNKAYDMKCKITFILIFFGVLLLSGCGNEEPKTASDKVKESIQHAADVTKEAAHDMSVATKEAAHDASVAADEAIHDAKNATK